MNLFVYGTLQSIPLMQAVAGGRLGNPVVAQLSGFAVRKHAGDVVPLLCSAVGQVADGIVFSDLDAVQMQRLDIYESAFGYELEDVTLATAQGNVMAQVYMPPAVSKVTNEGWSFSEWLDQHKAPAIAAATELFSLDPVPEGAQLRSMWPMIETRAWAKSRAVAGPAKHRYAPSQGDVGITLQHPPQGRFFRYNSVALRHRTFRNTQSDALPREAFVGIDAAILLPYDAARDRVLLVEQIRLGPALRGDPNPWMLEPIAGIVDARETPEEAAYREAAEEAQIKLDHLAHAGPFYPAPGATTDYFYTYVGLCELPMTQAYLGGLPGESEDLRLHPLSFEAAMNLLDTGEIATGPLFYLLYWLARHRARLRSLT